MAIREMVVCTRCGKTEPTTLRTRICVRRLLFKSESCSSGFSMPVTKSIDLCEDCWNDFERFVCQEE